MKGRIIILDKGVDKKDLLSMACCPGTSKIRSTG